MPVKSNLPALRHLLAARMLERGGGTIPETAVDVARIMGVSHTTIIKFARGDLSPSVELCIRMAPYLGLPVGDVLRMAGHADVAAMLGDPAPKKEPPELLGEAARILSTLSATEQQTVIATARNVANHLRAAKAAHNNSRE